MEISPLQSKAKAESIPLEQLASNPNVSPQEKVREASRQFEAVLLRQILSEARKTVMPSSENSGSGDSAGIYADMINNQMAESISRSGTFGLAKSLEAQLSHQVLPNASATTPQPTPLTGSVSKPHPL